MSSSRVKYADHTYRDFSRFTDGGGQLIKHKKSEANFPAKLHKMVSDPRHSRIITWMVSYVYMIDRVPSDVAAEYRIQTLTIPRRNPLSPTEELSKSSTKMFFLTRCFLNIMCVTNMNHLLVS